MSSINLFPVLDDEDEQDRSYKNGHNEQKEDELIVFGYSCKLFRDDFSAKAIDRGQNLIPWNGDENVMIDRYDCRGHLFDLTPWDSDILQKQSKIAHHSMSETERRIEEECERERYLDLHKDLEKEALYKEEESKRLNMDKNSYSQVGFTYDNDSNKSKESSSKSIDETAQPLDDDEYEPFYPPEKLRIPYGMDIPESIKLNTIIEKTASFVSDSGLQMEIVLKTKQANNRQFDFLKYDHYLNPYYRHLISMIKSGKYRPNIDGHSNVKTEKEKSIRNGIDQHSVHDDEDDAGDSYLHPLLRGGTSNESNQTNKKMEEPVKIPSLAMNIHDTAYGVLIKKYEHLRQREKVVKENEDSKLSTASDDNKNEESSPRSESSSSSHTVIPPPPDVKPIIDKLAEYVARNGTAFEQSIKIKNDPRFAFLERDHIHHNYYQLKLQICSQEIQKKELEETQQSVKNSNDDERTFPTENVKLTLKSISDDSQKLIANPAFQSDEDSNSMAPDLNEPDESEEFIGPRPPSPEFLEKIRKQEERRGRLNDFVREKIARDKQEERKRKAELLVQKLKTQNNEIVESISTVSNENPTINPVLVEKLLNVKSERPSSSLITSPKTTGRSRNSRSSSKSRKYHRRSRSRSDGHRRSKRSSHRRSRTRSRSRSRQRSKRSKNSKSSRYSRDRRHRRYHHRRHRDSTSGSSSSRTRSSRSSSESSSSSSTSSSNERKKKKKIDDETKYQQQNLSKSNPQSKKWDQREPIKIKRNASNTESTTDSLTTNKTTPSNSAAS